MQCLLPVLEGMQGNRSVYQVCERADLSAQIISVSCEGYEHNNDNQPPYGIGLRHGMSKA